MTIRRLTLALLAAMPLCLPAMANESEMPACAAGLAPRHDGVCVAPMVADLDSELRKSQNAARAKLSGAARALLDADQASYDAMLDGASTEATRFDVATQMVLRRDFLAAIRASRGKWVGDFANATGSLSITRRQAGGFVVRLRAAEAVLGTWHCEVEEFGVVEDGVLTAGQASAALDLGGPNEGWTLSFRLEGDVMMVREHAPEGAGTKPPFCTGEGRIEGAYFAQAPADIPVRAARK
mgnify:CR=1 FL=1